MNDEHQGDEFDQARAFLLAQPAPAAAEPVDALRLLAELARESDELYALAELGTPASLDEVAGFRRRRAYVWVHLAEKHPQFEETARAELAAWQAAEAAVITAAVTASTSR